MAIIMGRASRRALLGLLLLGAAAMPGRAQNDAAATLLDLAAKGPQGAADVVDNLPPHMTPAAADWKSDAPVAGVSWVGGSIGCGCV